MTPIQTRTSYLIAVSNGDRQQRIALRNLLWKLGGNEILPGLFWVALTDGEKQMLNRRFGKLRIRQR